MPTTQTSSNSIRPQTGPELQNIIRRFQDRPKTTAGQVFRALVCFTQRFSAAHDDKAVDMLGLERGNTVRAYGYLPELPETKTGSLLQFFAAGDLADVAEQIEVGKNYRAQLRSMFAADGHAAAAPFAHYQTTWSGLRIESIEPAMNP